MTGWSSPARITAHRRRSQRPIRLPGGHSRPDDHGDDERDDAVGVALVVAGTLADRLDVDQPGAGALIKVVGRLAELPWIAITPFAPALAWAVSVGVGEGSVGLLEVIVVGGLGATLVANAVYDPLRRAITRTPYCLAWQGSVAESLPGSARWC